MVLTRSKKKNFSHIDDVLEVPSNLDESSEVILSKLCLDFKKLKINHPEIELGHIESAIALLLCSLNEAEGRCSALEALLKDCNVEIGHLQSAVQREKSKRMAELNDSLTIQDSLCDDKDSLVSKNDCLRSDLGIIKDKLHHMEVLNNSLNLLLSEKERNISDFSNKIEQQSIQISKFMIEIKELNLKLDDSEARTWLTSRWLDDRVLDSYFEAFGANQSSVASKTLFFGPSITQIVKFGSTDDIESLLNTLSFNESRFSFFCLNNNIDQSKSDSGSHWSLLFVDLLANEAFHFDSLHNHNFSSAKLLINKLGLSLKLVDVECMRQNNNYECGLNVLIYAKLLKDAYCSTIGATAHIPFLEWYTKVILNPSSLHLNTPKCINFNEKLPTKRLKNAKSSIVLPHKSKLQHSAQPGWVLVNKSKKHKPISTPTHNIENSNPYSILSPLEDSSLSLDQSSLPEECSVFNLAKSKFKVTRKTERGNNKPLITRDQSKCQFDGSSSTALQADSLVRKVRNVVLLTDSHGRNMRQELNSFFQNKLSVQAVIMPNGKYEHVIEGDKLISGSLGVDDFVVIMAGTNNVPDNCGSLGDALHSVLEKFKKPTKIICGLPKRFDAAHLNMQISAVNSELCKIVENCKKAKFISLDCIPRSHYTRHGLHLNVRGKRLVADLIIKSVTSDTSKNMCRTNNNTQPQLVRDPTVQRNQGFANKAIGQKSRIWYNRSLNVVPNSVTNYNLTILDNNTAKKPWVVRGGVWYASGADKSFLGLIGGRAMGT